MIFRSLLLLASVLLVAGCESISDAGRSVRDRVAAREAPTVRSFGAAPRTVYEAARTAATNMGYRITRGGAAQGELEAISSVTGGDRMGSARQLSMKVKINKALDGGSEVRVRITEIIEPDSSNRAGVATESPLRDTPQYEVFFQRVAELIAAPPR